MFDPVVLTFRCAKCQWWWWRTLFNLSIYNAKTN